MKTHSQNSSWTADADQRFSGSKIGAEIVTLLQHGSRSQRQLSEHILRDPVFVATRGIEDLATAANVSTSTISRYVRDLGLDNYGEFRSKVGDTVRDLIAPVTKLGESMQNATQRQGAPESSFAAAQLHLDSLASPSTSELIRATTRSIASAANVFVLGFGFSAHLSAFLTLGLQPYRDRVINVAQYGGTEAAAARMMSIQKGDVLFAISFPRYSNHIIDIVRFAKDNEATVVALTDSSAAPLARYADLLLLAPAQHPVISSSCVPGLLIIEALVSDFLLSDSAHLERARKLTSAIASYLTP